MKKSIYKVVGLIGSSQTSWGEAAKNAAEAASNSLRDLRIAEIAKLDIRLEDGRIKTFRARVNQSFKIESQEQFYNLSKLMGIYP